MKKSITGISFNIVMDSRVTPKGVSKIYLRLKENRVKRDIFTKIRWPREFFDVRTQQLLPRFENDPDAAPHNLRINEFKAVAHRLQLNGYLKDQALTIDDLVKEFQTVGYQADFFKFMESTTKELYRDNIIVYETWNRHKSSLRILKAFHKKAELPMAVFSLEYVQRFDAWARRTAKKAHNTVCGYHKDIKKYLGIALRKGLIAQTPYSDFKFAYVDGDRLALDTDEVGRLYQKVYLNHEVDNNEREICRRFLFSCVTGLRITDSSRVHRKMIFNNQIHFTPFKGRASGKIVKIPLSDIALALIAGREGLLFETFSHGYINETLKVIAARGGIYKRLTYHCARDTFGTLFVEMGGDLKSLKDIMGHKSIKTTTIYLKMSDKRKADLMNNFNKLFKTQETFVIM